MCNGRGLYIHIPFCVKKCGYCDFFSLPGQSEPLKKRYSERLIEEISAIDEQVETVFIGGGTPSVLPLHLLLDIVRACPIRADGEFTVEINPGTVDECYLSALRRAGVNRLSIGVQSLQDSELKTLGRIHTVSDFYNCYDAARRAGFDNINVDLMFAFPGQTVASFSDTLQKICALKPEHVSCYALIVEEGTPFYDEGVREISPELDRELYHLAVNCFESNGYTRYETSNFAQRGYACKHNVNYWQCGEYYGCGAAAHSFLDGKRCHHPADIENYMKDGTVVVDEVLSAEEQSTEFCIMMLRMTEGIDKQLFEKRFGFALEERFGKIIAKWVEAGLLLDDEKSCRLTDEGMDLANTVMCDFL